MRDTVRDLSWEINRLVKIDLDRKIITEFTIRSIISTRIGLPVVMMDGKLNLQMG